MQLKLLMLKFRETFSRQDAKAQRKALRAGLSLRLCAFAGELRKHGRYSTALMALLLVVTTGCRRDMQDQPKMKAYRGTTFFGDGLSSRQPIDGTIARGYLRENTEFHTGKKKNASPTATQPQPGTPVDTYPDDITTFPMIVTEEVVKRGRERYDIFCSACHGLTGNGDGMIVRRGFRRAASFNDDRLRQAPVGHYFDAITNGWGAMPSYASQIPPQDRWAIVAYIRALQVSQQNPATASGASPAASPVPSPTPTPAAGGHE